MKGLFSCFGSSQKYKDNQVLPVANIESINDLEEDYFGYRNAEGIEDLLQLFSSVTMEIRPLSDVSKDKNILKRGGNGILVAPLVTYTLKSKSSGPHSLGSHWRANALMRVLAYELGIKIDGVIDNDLIIDALLTMKALLQDYPHHDEAEDPSGLVAPVHVMLSATHLIITALKRRCKAHSAFLLAPSPLLKALLGLVKASIRLRGHVEFDTSRSPKDLWCRMVTTTIHTVHVVSSYLWQQSGTVTDEVALHLSSCVRSTCKLLVTARFMCGAECNNATLLFWATCEHAMRVIYPHHNANEETGHGSNVALLHRRTPLLKDIWEALISVGPGPQEFFMEINRLFTQHSRSGKDGYGLQLLGHVGMSVTGSPTSVLGSAEHEHVFDHSGLGSLSSLSPFSSTSGDFCGLSPNITYVLMGLKYIVQLAGSHESIGGAVISRHHDWAAMLSEALLFSVQHGFLATQKEQQSVSLGLGRTNVSDDSPRGAARRREFCALCPLLGELLLLVTSLEPSGGHLAHSGSTAHTICPEWLVMEGSRLLLAFGETCRRAVKWERRQHHAAAVQAAQEQAVRDAAISRLEARPTMSTSPVLTMAVGQSVQALVQLSNGSKRWFPGVISAAQAAQRTYTIAFDDGDVAQDKPESEVRPRRVRSNSRASSTTSNGLGDSLLHLSDSSVLPQPAHQPLGSPAAINSLTTVASAASLSELSGVETPQPTTLESSSGRKYLRSSIPTLPIGSNSGAADTKSDGALVSASTGELGGLEAASAAGGAGGLKGEEDDESDFIFEIPPVFDDEQGNQLARSNSRTALVPSMELNQDDLRGNMATPQFGALGASLSSSLVEELEGDDDDDDDDGGGGDGDPLPLSPTGTMGNTGRDSASLTQAELFTGRSQATLTSSLPHGVLGKDQGAGVTKDELFDIWHRDGSLDEEQLSYACRTFCIMSLVLLNQCARADGCSVTVAACMTQSTHGTHLSARIPTTLVIPESARSVLSVGSMSAAAAGGGLDQQVNVLYSLRFFLEAVEGSESMWAACVPLVLATARFRGLNAAALLKLSMRSLSADSVALAAVAEPSTQIKRIGEGSFGSVYRVHVADRVPTLAQKRHLPAGTYVMKKVARERSMRDNPGVIDSFYETMCLLRLQERNCQGACRLFDYGITDKEYFFMLENGWLDLSAWRLSLPISSLTQSVSVGATEISLPELLLLLLLDAIKVLAQVHKCGVVHFDVKCRNFVLRSDPMETDGSSRLLGALAHNEPSGLLFLADFGESLPTVALAPEITSDSEGGSGHYRPAMIQRSRGTLCVQSPEMLTVNENNKSGSDAAASSEVRASPLLAFAPPDETSDVWSLGLAAVELFTGKMLFQERQWAELVVLLCSKVTTNLGSDDTDQEMQSPEDKGTPPPALFVELWSAVREMCAGDNSECMYRDVEASLSCVLRGALQINALRRASMSDLQRKLLASPCLATRSLNTLPLSMHPSPPSIDARDAHLKLPPLEYMMPSACEGSVGTITLPQCVVALGGNIMINCGDVKSSMVASSLPLTEVDSSGKNPQVVMDPFGNISDYADAIFTSLGEAGPSSALMWLSRRQMTETVDRLVQAKSAPAKKPSCRITLSKCGSKVLMDGENLEFSLARVLSSSLVSHSKGSGEPSEQCLLLEAVAAAKLQGHMVEVIVPAKTWGNDGGCEHKRGRSHGDTTVECAAHIARPLVALACLLAYNHQRDAWHSYPLSALDMHAPWLGKMVFG